MLDILADIHGFEEDFVHQLVVARHAGGSVKFEAIFVFEYAKSLKYLITVLFHRFKKLFELFN